MYIYLYLSLYRYIYLYVCMYVLFFTHREGEGGDGGKEGERNDSTSNHVRCKQQKFKLVSAEKENNTVCAVLSFGLVQQPKTVVKDAVYLSLGSATHSVSSILMLASHRSGHVMLLCRAREVGSVVREEELSQNTL